MRRLLIGAITLLGLLSSTALSAEKPWTYEETLAGVKKTEYVRYAFAGRVQTLRNLYALNLDCVEDAGWEFEITKQPEHGVANIEPSSYFPTYTKDNPRFKCNERKIQAKILTYQPKDGYKGQDSLTVLAISPTGLAYEETYVLNVRAVKPTGKAAETIPVR